MNESLIDNNDKSNLTIWPFGLIRCEHKAIKDLVVSAQTEISDA